MTTQLQHGDMVIMCHHSDSCNNIPIGTIGTVIDDKEYGLLGPVICVSWPSVVTEEPLYSHSTYCPSIDAVITASNVWFVKKSSVQFFSRPSESIDAKHSNVIRKIASLERKNKDKSLKTRKRNSVLTKLVALENSTIYSKAKKKTEEPRITEESGNLNQPDPWSLTQVSMPFFTLSSTEISQVPLNDLAERLRIAVRSLEAANVRATP